MKLTIDNLRKLIRESWADDFDQEMEKNRLEYEARKKAQLEDPVNKPFIDAIMNARDPKELARAKRALLKADDAGEITISAGFWLSVYNAKKAELASIRYNEKQFANPAKTAQDARADRILRIRDSSGRARARKW